jgi:DNA excision repair protein ERCC-3
LDGYLYAEDLETREWAWGRYRRYLLKREGLREIKVKPKATFSLILELLHDGILPFSPRPVEEDDRRPLNVRFTPREYQVEAFKRFMELGAVGLFWAPGVGKTYLACMVMAAIKGRKLIIVPTATLREQWQEAIRSLTYLPEGEYEVQTYQYAVRYYDKYSQGLSLVIYDECQSLPANTFSRLAAIKAKYRLGLSATPFREDGRVDLIFALTGFPLGLSWDTFFQLGLIRKPIIKLYVTGSMKEKLELVMKLAREAKGKTLIYSDSLDLGHRLAEELGLEFVHGDTPAKRRLELLKAEKVVVSRVADEGLDLTKIQAIIEADFLMGSRRQELQRVGRLLHSHLKAGTRHYIVMTDEELALYGKRLYGLYSKGFDVEVIRYRPSYISYA